MAEQKGYLWAFPSPNDFVVEKGDGTLKDYHFGKKTIAHKFCPNCGTAVMAERGNEGPSTGINVRTFKDFDEEKYEKTPPYNGAGLEPHYAPPADGPEVSDLDRTTKCYRGSCHCGKVSYDLQSQPLEEIGILSCNCSICSRNADLWVYPMEKDVKLRGENHLTVYRFGRKVGGHAFCSTCGVPVVNKLRPPPDGDAAEGIAGRLPVNVRTINGIDLNALPVNKADGKNLRGDPYEV
ncbi:MAG: hypothetical protein Q9161_003223 [Pseudevernia consocians]